MFSAGAVVTKVSSRKVKAAKKAKNRFVIVDSFVIDDFAWAARRH
jgi:hypothetical protein